MAIFSRGLHLHRRCGSGPGRQTEKYNVHVRACVCVLLLERVRDVLQYLVHVYNVHGVHVYE